MIPKIIHYCWLSNDPIPAKLQEYMDTWKKKLPDYEFVLWDTNRFNINSCLWTKQAFENKKYAFAADYIRLYAVYHYGGIYMDMDVEVIKSFNPLLCRNAILGRDADGIEAGVFGADKQAEWVRDCLEYYKERSFIKNNGTFDIFPLPNIMYNILNKKYIDSNILQIEEEDFFTAKSSETGKINCTENTYTIHHFNASWQNKKQKLFRLISRIIGKKVTHKIANIAKKYAFYKVI